MRFLLEIILCIPWIWATPVEYINYISDSGGGTNSTANSRGSSVRIIGGIQARAGQFPFAAAIRVASVDANTFCGGALLSNLWVLTTAHCVEGAIGIEIRLGSNSLTDDDEQRVVVSTGTYFMHPEYNNTTLENDIALIKFRDRIEYSDYIGNIYLPVASYSAGTNVTAIGWGQTNDSEPVFADHLQYVSLVLTSNDDCNNYYDNQITANMVCAMGQYDEGICTGDSGSPLIYLLNNRHPIIVAVATFFSRSGCETIEPSGYTRVFPYKGWILNTTGTL